MVARPRVDTGMCDVGLMLILEHVCSLHAVQMLGARASICVDGVPKY